MSNRGSPNGDDANCCLFPLRNTGASHSNCSLVIDMPGLVFLLRRHGNQGMALRRQQATSHLSPRRYVTSPSRIIPSPVTSESFNGVNPGTKGRENTRHEECASKAIEQPHDEEQPLVHGAYLGGDGAAKKAVSSHG